MTVETANALGGYFQALYDLNHDLITLCGMDIIDNSGQYEKYIKNVIQAVPRLVPYDYDVKNQNYRINRRDGLLEFSDQLPFLLEDYEMILQRHGEFLSKVKIIRNKFEHKMHGARLVAGGSVSGSVAFDMTYEVGDQKIELTASEIIRFTKDINCTFSRIQKLIDTFAYENENLIIRIIGGLSDMISVTLTKSLIVIFSRSWGNHFFRFSLNAKASKDA